MELLKGGLTKIIKNSDPQTKLKSRKEEKEHFVKFYETWSGRKLLSNEQRYNVIPKFYRSELEYDSSVRVSRLREESLSIFLQNKGLILMTNDEIKSFCILLDTKNSVKNRKVEDSTLDYLSLKFVATGVSHKCRKFFKPSVFAMLQKKNLVNIVILLNYAMRKTWLQHSRMGLALYDTSGKGYLREGDLERYIRELIPTLPILISIGESFKDFYVCTAVRKFIFFLDPMRTGKIKIYDILASGFLDDLLELRDEELPQELQDINWFSASSAFRVYGQYLNLDKDHNGMLSKNELTALGTGTLTDAFLDRVFQELLTFDGEMDYKTYLDFILALENRNDPQSLHYLFKILDVNGKGYLNAYDFNYFFRSIHNKIKPNVQEPINFYDMKDELYDMIKPLDPFRITLQDIINSGQGDTFVNILIDANGFWAYENREHKPIEDSNDSQD